MLTNAEEGPLEPREDEPDVRWVPTGLFTAWRRAMSAAVSVVSRATTRLRALARTWAFQWRLVPAYHAGSALPWDQRGEPARQAAASVGLRAFVFGAIATGIGISMSTSLWLPVAVGVGSQVLWAGARFIIVAVLMPPGVISRARLSTAYLAGLLPYALAVTWLLQLVALGASAMLTHRGLTGAGVTTRDARTAIAWAFGGQATIIVGGWAMRALIVLVAG